jgi:hypothetical protein
MGTGHPGGPGGLIAIRAAVASALRSISMSFMSDHPLKNRVAKAARSAVVDTTIMTSNITSRIVTAISCAGLRPCRITTRSFTMSGLLCSSPYMTQIGRVLSISPTPFGDVSETFFSVVRAARSLPRY